MRGGHTFLKKEGGGCPEYLLSLKAVEGIISKYKRNYK